MSPLQPSRRELLALAAAAAGLGATGVRDGRRPRLLVVFLTGGNDGLNTVLPYGDPQFGDPALRPSIAIPESRAIDLGNSFAAMHPALAPLHELFRAGQLAFLHRVGYAEPNLSHFSSQRYWETACPGDDRRPDGFLYRLAASAWPDHPAPAVCLAQQFQRMFRGPRVLPHVSDLDGYRARRDPSTKKLLGSLEGGGLRDAFDDRDELGATGRRVASAGRALLTSLELFGELPADDAPPERFPRTEAHQTEAGLPPAPWVRDLMGDFRDAARLLRHTDVRVLGTEYDGFDSHVLQGGLVGVHADRLRALAVGIRGLWEETRGGVWDDLVVLCLSEFGRATRENGGAGTDHGAAGVLIAAGGRVRGGVHDCDAESWPPGETLFSSDGKHVAPTRDYRAVLAEVFERHLGLGPEVTGAAIPGLADLRGPLFRRAGFLG